MAVSFTVLILITWLTLSRHIPKDVMNFDKFWVRVEILQIYM